MVKKFWTEYGLVGVLIVIAVGGYLLLGENREDILTLSLDSIGEHLVDLVDDREAKAKTADTYADFKEKVEAKEVTPEQFERTAANVLNLSTSGANLSPEEIEMVLSLAVEGEVNALPVPDAPFEHTGETGGVTPVEAAPDIATHTWTPATEQEVGARVAAMVAFSDKMKQMAIVAGQAAETNLHVQYVVNDGIQVIVDSVVSGWQDNELQTLTADLVREKRVVWDKNLANARRKHFEHLKAQREKIAVTRGTGVNLAPPEARKIMALERLNRLQEKGIILDTDSTMLRIRMDVILQEVLRELKKGIGAAKEDTFREEQSSS